jgi:hypothetical protein
MRSFRNAVFVVAIIVLLFPLTAYAGGFDQYGFNYQAHIFNGSYCAAWHNPSWCTGDVASWRLLMKWNDAYLSADDTNKDGQVDPHPGRSTYIGSGAWVQEHEYGSYRDASGVMHFFIYDAKIVAKSTPYSSCGNGYEIWDDFCVVQEIYNDPYIRLHGVEFQPDPPGLGKGK